MRSNLIHEYHRIRLDELWRVAAKDVPDLIDLIEPLIRRPES